MTTKEEKIALVTKGVEAFANVENLSETLKMKIDEALDAVVDCFEGDIGKQGQFLRVQNLLIAAKGDVANGLEKIIHAHSIGTKAAQEADCDVAIPNEFVIDGGVTTLSGGR